jgi:hypothetical protein
MSQDLGPKLELKQDCLGGIRGSMTTHEVTKTDHMAAFLAIIGVPQPSLSGADEATLTNDGPWAP